MPTRTESENIIRMLCEHYPNTFSEKNRRPLKKDIAADIAADQSFEVDHDLTRIAVDWYASHISYQYGTAVAGSKRIDLDGKVAGTVTAPEAATAQRYVDEYNAKRKAAQLQQSPVKILNQMHNNNQISDCAMKKLDAPPVTPAKTKTTVMMEVTATEFAALYEILTAANTAMSGIAGPPELRDAIAKAALTTIAKKIQQMLSEATS
jgi:sRNA-binding protein